MQKDILTRFGQRLKDIRTSKGLSQEDLSRLSGVDRTYVSDVERGLRNISIENVKALADALAIPVYQFFLWENNVFERWDVSLAQIERLILDNPSLRGFLIGYLAEAKLQEQLEKDRRISSAQKSDDHDRRRKHDLVVRYKGETFSIEIKSLQTGSVKPSKIAGIELEARFQCDASDRRKIKLKNGRDVETTCLQFGEFDILAVNLFAFREKWEFAFALNQDLPSSEYKKYPKAIRKQLIKSIIAITLPLQPPFVSDPFVLLERLHQARARS